MKKIKSYKIWIFSLIFALFSLFQAGVVEKTFAFAEEDLKISSKSALLVDYDSNQVIYEKNADERLPIASMTKLASLSIVFDYLNKGIIKEDDLVVVSKHAGSIGGSSAFLDAGSSYRVSDLIKSVVMASANDSMVALSEFISGSEDLFVVKMNKFAKDLGLTNTHFSNSTGLPVEEHYSSARDMVEIYKTIANNSLYKKYSKIWMDDFIHPSGRKTGLVNTNRLVKTFDGIDGGKTGYTDKAKFCLTASATRGDTRLIGVIIGAENSKTRFSEMGKLLNFGFANYETKLIIDHTKPLTICKFKNSKNDILAYPERDVKQFIQKSDDLNCTSEFEITANRAPIAKGDVIGKMFVFDSNNMVIEELNVVAGDDAKEIGFKENLTKIFNKW